MQIVVVKYLSMVLLISAACLFPHYAVAKQKQSQQITINANEHRLTKKNSGFIHWILGSADMQNSAPLEERVNALRSLLVNGEADGALKAVDTVPEMKEPTDDKKYAILMEFAVALNNLALIRWLNENCADCVLADSGAGVLNSQPLVFEGMPWRSMNFDTFKYVYEQGGVESYTESEPYQPIVIKIADYWIPAGDGVYGDYIVVEDDIKYEAERNQHRIDMLSYLFENGHDVNETSKDQKQTALFAAVDQRNDKLIDFLIANGADITVGDNPVATVTGNVTPVFLTKLVKIGYNLNEVTAPFYSSPSARTLLGRIVQGRKFKPELLAILEDNNVDFNLVDTHGKAPIDYAYKEYGQEEQPYTNYLLERGAQITNQYYYSVLVDAIQSRKPETIQSILTGHPKLANGLQEDEDKTPIERAVWAGNIDSVKLLLDSGANLSLKKDLATNLLVGALSRKNYEMAKLFLDHNPDIPVNSSIQQSDDQSVKPIQRSRALYEVSADGNLDWVQILLEKGASLEAGSLRDYPIYGSALNGHLDVVKVLLDAGSPANPVDKEDGESLFDVLEEYDASEMLELLKNFDKSG